MKTDPELLKKIASESNSITDVIRALGLKPNGGNFRSVKSRLLRHNVDISHFTGRGWAKGLTRDTDSRVKEKSDRKRTDNSEIFKENSHVYSSQILRKRLLELGWEYKCKECKIDTWQGKPLTLHLDHINGVHTDNRYENLRFLCPNCHQQTETWGSRLRPGDPIPPKKTYANHWSRWYRKKKEEKLDQDKAEKKQKYCEVCSKPCVKRFCSQVCSRQGQRKATWPTREELIEILREESILSYSKRIGVSDNAVRRWMKKYDLTLKEIQLTKKEK